MINVEFFGREDYKEANKNWIRKHWDARHVLAFLDVVGLRSLSDPFKASCLNHGKHLLTLNTLAALKTFLHLEDDGKSEELSDAMQLVASINELGDLDYIEVLSRVNEHVEIM